MSQPEISPLAKRLAEENNVNWHTLQGSGPAGKVVERDVLEYLSRVMAGEEDVNPTPEPTPEGMESWPEEDVVGFQTDTASPSSDADDALFADDLTMDGDLLGDDLDDFDAAEADELGINEDVFLLDDDSEADFDDAAFESNASMGQPSEDDDGVIYGRASRGMAPTNTPTDAVLRDDALLDNTTAASAALDDNDLDDALTDTRETAELDDAMLAGLGDELDDSLDDGGSFADALSDDNFSDLSDTSFGDTLNDDTLADDGFGDALDDDGFGDDGFGDDAFGSDTLADDGFGDALSDDAFGSDSLSDDAFGSDSLSDDALGDDGFGDDFGELDDDDLPELTSDLGDSSTTFDDALSDDAFGDDSLSDNGFGDDSFDDAASDMASVALDDEVSNLSSFNDGDTTAEGFATHESATSDIADTELEQADDFDDIADMDDMQDLEDDSSTMPLDSDDMTFAAGSTDDADLLAMDDDATYEGTALHAEAESMRSDADLLAMDDNPSPRAPVMHNTEDDDDMAMLDAMDDINDDDVSFSENDVTDDVAAMDDVVDSLDDDAMDIGVADIAAMDEDLEPTIDSSLSTPSMPTVVPEATTPQPSFQSNFQAAQTDSIPTPAATPPAPPIPASTPTIVSSASGDTKRITLRRYLDLELFNDLQEQIVAALGEEATVAMVQKAAVKALEEVPLTGYDVSVLDLRQGAPQVKSIPNAANMSLSGLVRAMHGATDGKSDMLVADLSRLEADELSLDSGVPVLSLGRIRWSNQQGEATSLAMLSLSGNLNAEMAGRFLTVAAEMLENPLLLLL